jgi:hypothetical protein
MSLILAVMSFLGSCATGGECAWAKRIQVNEQDFITRPTAEQIVAHNRKVAAFCR